MKTIKFILRKYGIALTCLVIGIGGCQNNPVAPIMGSVSGIITMSGAFGMNSTPLAGVTVWLINRDFKPDTVNLQNNKAAFIDSAVTDTNGRYTISITKAGNYGVVPMPGTQNYIFSLAEKSDSCLFTVNHENQTYSVNFTTPDPSTFDQGFFTLNFQQINFPDSSGDFQLSPSREYWTFFIPDLVRFPSYRRQFFSAINGSSNYQDEWPYGFTALVSSMSNKFKYDCYADGVYKFSFWINLPLTGCPASSTWQIDWAAGTVTRIN